MIQKSRKRRLTAGPLSLDPSDDIQGQGPSSPAALWRCQGNCIDLKSFRTSQGRRNQNIGPEVPDTPCIGPGHVGICLN